MSYTIKHKMTSKKKDINKIYGNIKSMLEIHSNKVVVLKNSKNVDYLDQGNANIKDKRYIWKVINEEINNEFLKNNNYGIICNKKSGLTGVDLDTHKWKKNNLFNEEFGTSDTFIKNFDTYSQITPNGGYHFIFEYDSDLNQVQSTENSNFGEGIDIRNGHTDKINSGGYLLGAGSVVKNNNNEFKIYKCINDTTIKKIPEKLKNWLLNNIYTNSQKKNIKEKTNKIINEQPILNTEPKYSFFLSSEQTETEILNKLNIDYFNNYSSWLIFTSAMKTLNFKKLWTKYSLRSNKYDEEKNNKIWNSIKINEKSFFIESVIKSAGCDIDNLIKFKNLPKDLKKADLLINRSKLSYIKNEIITDNNKPLDFNENFNNSYVIKSDTGTGKTTLMKEGLLKTNQKFISIVSRVSLGIEQYRTFNQFGINCKFYKNSYAEIDDSIITTIDSITSCYKLMDNINEYTIFIDEFNSVLEYIFQADATVGKNRSTIWQFLIHILHNCKNFICVDADISDVCHTFLKHFNKPYTYIINEYKHNNGIIAEEIYELNDLIKIINTKKKYMVCCDSKKSAEYIWLQTGKKAKLLTATTDKLNDSTLDNYDCIIFSPTIIYGLDSIIRRDVFCYHKEFTISPTNMIQQIARCRNIIKLYFCFQKKEFTREEYNNLDHCRKEMKLKNDFSNKEFFPLTDEEKERENLFNMLYTDYKYKMDCFNTNKAVHFKNLLYNRGFNIIYNLQITEKPDKKEIGEIILNWKLEEFNIDSPHLISFNEKYLNLTNTQLIDIKDLFIDDELLRNVILNLEKKTTHYLKLKTKKIFYLKILVLKN